MRIDGSPIREKRAVPTFRAISTPSAVNSASSGGIADLASVSMFSKIISPGPEQTEKLARLKRTIASDGYRTPAMELGHRIVLFYLTA